MVLVEVAEPIKGVVVVKPLAELEGENNMNPILKKRLLGLAWGAGITAVLAVLSYTIKAVPSLGLPEIWSMLLLAVLQQVTKWLNTKYQLGKAVLGAFRK